MKRRKPIVVLLRLCIVFCVVHAALKFYDAMPSYGIKNKTFKAVLHTLLSGDVPKISVKDAAAKKDSTLFLDAREKEEYEVSHLPHSVFVGYESFALNSLRDISKERKLIHQCP